MANSGCLRVSQILVNKAFGDNVLQVLGNKARKNCQIVPFLPMCSCTWAKPGRFGSFFALCFLALGGHCLQMLCLPGFGTRNTQTLHIFVLPLLISRSTLPRNTYFFWQMLNCQIVPALPSYRGALKWGLKATLCNLRTIVHNCALSWPFFRNEKSAQRGSFGPDIPADIRPKTSVRPSKFWKTSILGWTSRADVHEKTSVRKTSGCFFCSLFLGPCLRATFVTK